MPIAFRVDADAAVRHHQKDENVSDWHFQGSRPWRPAAAAIERMKMAVTDHFQGSRAGWRLAIVEYAPIVCWEGDNLSRNFGHAYEAFRRSTPRWLPSLRDMARRLGYPAATATKGVGALGSKGSRPIAATGAGKGSGRFSWAAALEHERYTWLNVALALALMLAKESM